MTDLFGNAIEEKKTPLRKGEVLSEIAPGQFASHLEVWELPTYVLSRLVPTGDGSYHLEMVDEWIGWIPLNEIKSRLGIKGISGTTLRRLCVTGFLEHCQPTPQIYLVKIDSLIEHLEQTKNAHLMEDPYWSEQRRQLWRTSCGM